MQDIKYVLKNVNINVENPDDIVFPDMKSRTIVKTGDVVEFTMNEVEVNNEQLEKLKKELTAQIAHEKAVMENIEHFHKFVTEMSDEDLLTAWMYKESKGKVTLLTPKLEDVEKVLDESYKEIEEIKNQIPELNVAEEKNGENA